MLSKTNDEVLSESEDETKPHLCGFCDFSSSELDIFAKHFKDEHYQLPVNMFPCEKCDFSSDNAPELKTHRQTHRREDIVCEKCDFPCENYEILRQHTVKVHGEKKYFCYYCGLARTYKVRLMRHMVNRHIGREDYTITERKPVRPRVASSKVRPVSAYDNANDKIKLLVCKKCPYRTTNRLKFTVHQRQHEPGSVSFNLTCNECSFQTTSVSTLRDHVKTHANSGTGVFQCGQCSYKTSTLRDLQSHENKHNQPPSYNCNLCNFRSSIMGKLKTHKETHKTVEEPSDNDKENKFFCTQKGCNFTCSRLAELADHSEIFHRSDNVFECAQCDFSCSSLSRLAQHELSHKKSLRVYTCNVCYYEVANYAAFKKHVKTHVNDKSFSCSSCDYACGSLKKLLQHELKHAN